jgi:hypothetical protein
VFEVLPVPELQRLPFADAESWDSIQTIFPFLLRRANGSCLSNEETARVYRALQDSGVQLAQPVLCGKRDGVTVSALRLCVSSRLVLEAMLQNGSNAQAVIQRALVGWKDLLSI